MKFPGFSADRDSWFNRIFSLIFDILYLNLLFLFTSLPIITIGTSISSMYYTIAKVLKHNRSSITKAYFFAFRKNLKSSLIPSLVIILIIGLLLLDFFYAIAYGFNTTQGMFYLILACIFSFPIACVSIIIFPLLSRVEASPREYLRNAFLLSIKNAVTSFLLVIVLDLCILLTGFCFPLILIWPVLYYFVMYKWIEKILSECFSNPDGSNPWKE